MNIRNQLLLLGVFALSGCTNSFESVKVDVQQSIKDNQAASSLIEWNKSENHPEELFKRWNLMVSAGQLSSRDVCDVLEETNAADLTIFEEQLNEGENQELLKNCKDRLLTKIDDHFVSERTALVNNLDNYFAEDNLRSKETTLSAASAKACPKTFKFEDRVSLKDTSYRAVGDKKGRRGYYTFDGQTNDKEIILTFDDGPVGKMKDGAPGYTERILDILKRVNAKAVFFQLGKNVRANPDMVKRVAAEGHSVASHSMTHRCLGGQGECGKNTTGDETAAYELKAGFNEILNVLGYSEALFRFPYGAMTTDRFNFLAKQNIGAVHWNIDSLDWKTSSSSQLFDYTMNQVRQKGRGVVLFHDIHRVTAEALPQFLIQLNCEGYKIVLMKSKDLLRKSGSKP